MKANQLVLVAALFTGLVSFSFAGPSPSWHQPAEKQQLPKAACTTCACCAQLKKA
jgi:hypothetical protein